MKNELSEATQAAEAVAITWKVVLSAIAAAAVSPTHLVTVILVEETIVLILTISFVAVFLINRLGYNPAVESKTNVASVDNKAPLIWNISFESSLSSHLYSGKFFTTASFNQASLKFPLFNSLHFAVSIKIRGW